MKKFDIDLDTHTITINTTTSGRNLYSLLKTQWFNDPRLWKEFFPLEAIHFKNFEIVRGWKFRNSDKIYDW